MIKLLACLLPVIIISLLSCSATTKITSEGELVNRSIAKRHTGKQSSLRRGLARKILNLKGTPYKAGGISRSGFDCSGLIFYVSHRMGLVLPRTTGELAKMGHPVDISKARPGDLIFFAENKGINHVGMIIENKGRKLSFVDASSNRGVAIEALGDTEYLSEKFAAVRCVVDQAYFKK